MTLFKFYSSQRVQVSKHNDCILKPMSTVYIFDISDASPNLPQNINAYLTVMQGVELKMAPEEK